MRGFFIRLRDIWVILGITLSFFILLEIFFRIYFLFSSHSDPRIQSECYDNSDWVEDYFIEFNKCNTSNWKPYVYWSRRPFKGQFINVGEDHLRKTVFQQNPSVDYDPLIKIFMFGGSAMWGTGVRDAYTIPSLLGKEMTKEGFRVDITNFGESGYVSTQALIKLQLELRKGNIPDLIIFYDGANDLYSSLQQNRAGIPQNEKNREKEFNILTHKKKSLLVFFESLKTLATLKFIRRQFLSEPNYADLIADYDLEKLAEETVNIYDENLGLIYALSNDYGFKSIFYWQPLLLFKNNRSDYENLELEKMGWMNPFIKLSRENLTGEEIHIENLDFFDISNFFETETSPVFIDWCHTGEFGNTKLAKRIAKDAGPLCDSILVHKESITP